MERVQKWICHVAWYQQVPVKMLERSIYSTQYIFVENSFRQWVVAYIRVYGSLMLSPVKRRDIVLNFSVCPSVCPSVPKSLYAHLLLAATFQQIDTYTIWKEINWSFAPGNFKVIGPNRCQKCAKRKTIFFILFAHLLLGFYILGPFWLHHINTHYP